MKRLTLAAIAFAFALVTAMTANDAEAQNRGRYNYRPSVTMPHSTVNRPSVTMPHSVARQPNYRPITRPVNRQPSRPSVTMPHSTVNRPSVTMPHNVVQRPSNRPRPGYGAPQRRYPNLERQPGFTTRRYIGFHGSWR